MSNVGGAPDPWEGRSADRYRPPAGPRPDPGPPDQGGWDDRPGGWDDRPAAPYQPGDPYQSGDPYQRATPYQAGDPYQPGDPYQAGGGAGRGAGDPYQAPAQRYGPGGWDGGPPTYPAQPGQGGYPQEPYPGPGPKRRRGPLIAVLAVLVVVLLGGAAAYWLAGRDEPGATGPTTAAVEPTAGASEPDEPVATTPAPASSTDPRFVQAGQCVRNEGGTAQPKLVISECGAKTYQVLRRIDGATSGKKDAETKCAKVPGYTDWYFFDSDLDTLDFVLCLKQR